MSAGKIAAYVTIGFLFFAIGAVIVTIVYGDDALPKQPISPSLAYFALLVIGAPWFLRKTQAHRRRLTTFANTNRWTFTETKDLQPVTPLIESINFKPAPKAQQMIIGSQHGRSFQLWWLTGTQKGQFTALPETDYYTVLRLDGIHSFSTPANSEFTATSILGSTYIYTKKMLFTPDELQPLMNYANLDG